MKFSTYSFKTSVFVAMLMLAITTRAQQTCVTIKAGPTNSINADILSTEPNQTNRSTDYFQSMQWTYNGSDGESRDFMRFDLSSIPAGSVITSALLSLYADLNTTNGSVGSPDYGTSNATYLMQVTSPWTDSTVTWNSQPSADTNNEVLMPQSTSATENYPNLDITAFVQAWVNNPAQNYGIMSKITASSPYNSLIMASGHNSDSTLWPVLVICYQPASTNCITMKAGPTNSINADILSTEPNQTNRSTDYFQSMFWTYNGSDGESRDFMRFDLSSIPSGAVVTSATLSLYADLTTTNGSAGSPDYGTNNATYLMQVTSPWTDSTVTWSTQPSTDTNNEVLMAQSTSATENYPNLDITAFVRSWVNNPAQNYGIMSKITANSPYNSLIMGSGHNADSTFWPLLEICYNLGAGVSNLASSSNSISVYPNPNNGNLLNVNLPTGSDLSSAKVMVYDLLGDEIPFSLMGRNSQQIVISLDGSVISGMYLVGLKNPETELFGMVMVLR